MNASSEESGESDPVTPTEDSPGELQRQMTRRAEALIARQAEEARKKQEKK